MNRRNNALVGVIFVLIGIAFLLNSTLRFNILKIFDIGYVFSTFWATLFIILPGLAFHSIYFSGKTKSAGVLVPGGILLGVGIVCQISHLFGIWHLLWPGFILSVSFGLFELYAYGGKKKGLLIPVFILGGLSFIFFFFVTFGGIFRMGFGQYIIPIILIIIGISVIFKGNKKSSF